jgi:hypothetical protein
LITTLQEAPGFADAGADAAQLTRKSIMRRTGTMAFALVVGLMPGQLAFAHEGMTCAQAIRLVANHPDVEASSVVAMAMNQWEAMDRRTASGGHAPITQQMLATPGAINALSGQCIANPGQSLGSAAAQVYRVAREQIDGF